LRQKKKLGVFQTLIDNANTKVAASIRGELNKLKGTLYKQLKNKYKIKDFIETVKLIQHG